jgi:hypothetical protein
VDGTLIYSKKKTGEFPEDADIVRQVTAKKK